MGEGEGRCRQTQRRRGDKKSVAGGRFWRPSRGEVRRRGPRLRHWAGGTGPLGQTPTSPLAALQPAGAHLSRSAKRVRAASRLSQLSGPPGSARAPPLSSPIAPSAGWVLATPPATLRGISISPLDSIRRVELACLKGEGVRVPGRLCQPLEQWVRYRHPTAALLHFSV